MAITGTRIKRGRKLLKSLYRNGCIIKSSSGLKKLFLSTGARLKRRVDKVCVCHARRYSTCVSVSGTAVFSPQRTASLPPQRADYFSHCGSKSRPLGLLSLRMQGLKQKKKMQMYFFFWPYARCHTLRADPSFSAAGDSLPKRFHVKKKESSVYVPLAQQPTIQHPCGKKV